MSIYFSGLSYIKPSDLKLQKGVGFQQDIILFVAAQFCGVLEETPKQKPQMRRALLRACALQGAMNCATTNRLS